MGAGQVREGAQEDEWEDSGKQVAQRQEHGQDSQKHLTSED